MVSLTKNFSSSAYAISMLKHRFITMRHGSIPVETLGTIYDMPGVGAATPIINKIKFILCVYHQR